MKLLVITQKVDQNDPVLGFFHRWLEAFSQHFENVIVIALGKGEMTLPQNVTLYSLGKEEKNFQFSIFNFQKIRYLFRFYKYIWSLREEYDAVFVHMNQEYVLLGSVDWLLMGKPIYLWRNHAKGNFSTTLSVWFSRKVFYTSPQSFTARFKKARQMPVGIDTDFFKPNENVARIPNSLLFLGRIGPVKKVLEFVKWFNTLHPKMAATVAGEALPKDKSYEALVRKEASERIKFVGAVTQEEALRLYQSHETYVNKTLAGSFDKTIFEAAACETKVILDNEDLKFMENMGGRELREFVEKNHSLKLLADKLVQEIK